ncbi:hypothetical protein [Saccharopolyspora shandongensis]|uniref:hypothetical protein n=1 Tax=Saccharopolyspora shandongensis TaxID=418495 RepID=UPI0033FB9337
MAEADDDFDLSRVEKVLGRWWAEACSAANPAPYSYSVNFNYGFIHYAVVDQVLKIVMLRITAVY